MPLPFPFNTQRLLVRPPIRTDMRNWSALYRSAKVRRYMNGPLMRPAKVFWRQLQESEGGLPSASFCYRKVQRGVCRKLWFHASQGSSIRLRMLYDISSEILAKRLGFRASRKAAGYCIQFTSSQASNRYHPSGECAKLKAHRETWIPLFR